jgi:hypothetical protein
LNIITSIIMVDLYPAIIKKGNLPPGSFGAEVDAICNEINDACKVGSAQTRFA